MLYRHKALVTRLPLFSALALAMALTPVLTACGQTGTLYLPTEPAAAQRATLPQSLFSSSTAAGPPIALPSNNHVSPSPLPAASAPYR